MAAVTFDQIGKTYPDGFSAVRNFDLQIEDGEFMVLVGPSGCGKTTALRMVAGLEDISHGVLRIGERVVNHVPSRDRDIAMVFQSYALYPHLTVYENIAFGLRLKKVPKGEIDQRVQEAARVLDLEPHLKRKPRALSGGQRQRVAMGRAIVRRPQAFLMDEPLSNLDAKLRVQTRAEISKLQHSLGTTTIYVTHDQVEAMTMGDRVAVMRKGELQQVATPQTLYDRPGGGRLHGKLVLREALGSEIMAHFTVDAPPARTEEVAELAEDAGGELTEEAQHESLLIGRFGARSRVTEGDAIEAAVDTRALHFFDPETGLGIYEGSNTKGAG